MFEAYEQRPDPRSFRRQALSSLAAAGVLAAALAVTLSVSEASIQKAAQRSVEVAFRPPPPKPAAPKPPPPPAPKVQPRPQPKVVTVTPPPPTAAPVVVAAAAPIEAPKAAPKEKPKEASASEAVAAINVAVGGTGDGSGTAVGPSEPEAEKESAAPVVAMAGHAGPINLPEDADPADCTENEPPEYPEVARASGQEAKVVLKVVIEKDGSVGKLQVMKGEEPFVTAAISAIQRWRCSPAMLEGAALSVFKVINIPFRLRND